MDTPANQPRRVEPPATPASYAVPPAGTPSQSDFSLTPTNPPQPSMLRLFVLIAIAILGFGFFWYFNIANVGHLVIESDIPGAEVQIRRKGEPIANSINEREFELKTGTYDLRLLKPEQGYRLSQTTITITRDGRDMVKVVPIGK